MRYALWLGVLTVISPVIKSFEVDRLDIVDTLGQFCGELYLLLLLQPTSEGEKEERGGKVTGSQVSGVSLPYLPRGSWSWLLLPPEAEGPGNGLLLTHWTLRLQTDKHQYKNDMYFKFN